MANLDFSITEEEQNEVVNKLANLCGEDSNRLFSAVATSLSSKLLTHAPNQPGINDPEFVAELAQLEIYTKAIMLTNGIDKIQFQTEMVRAYKSYQKYFEDLEKQLQAQKEAEEAANNVTAPEESEDPANGDAESSEEE